MERLDCTVRLGGNIGSTTEKLNITVAEAILLRKIHGQDALVDIKKVRTGKRDNTPHRAELDRLKAFYPEKFHKAIDQLFPGFNPKLPMTLEEGGFVEEEDRKDAEKKAAIAEMELEPAMA